MKEKKIVQYNFKKYIWDNFMWYESETQIIPPTDVISKLNIIIEPELEKEDEKIKEVSRLIRRSQTARDMMQYRRSQNLARRILKLFPNHAGTLAILSSSLRAQGKPEEALRQTDYYKNDDYAPLLTSRAAAMCDLEMWDEAKREVGKALAISSNNQSAFSVVHRIKTAKPELYEDNKIKNKKKKITEQFREKKIKKLKVKKIKTSNQKALEKLKERLKQKEKTGQKRQKIKRFEFFFEHLGLEEEDDL